MHNFRLWFYRQNTATRFSILFVLMMTVSMGVTLLVNQATEEPWYRGGIGSIIVSLVVAYWCLGDRKLYEQGQKKYDEYRQDKNRNKK